MAVIQKVQITISIERDIDVVYWFYKLYPPTGPSVPTKSSLVKPSTKGSVPTDSTSSTYPWYLTEPAYTNGDTKCLYIVSLTYFTDGTSEFSEVSVSSSYEASKQAYGKAISAQEFAEGVSGELAAVQQDISDRVDSSQNAANEANQSYSELEKVIGVFSWISDHGEYTRTQDTSVVAGKYYFALISGKYTYVIPNDDVDPSSLGYYELVSADATLADYLSSHLVTIDNGLEIVTSGIDSKVQITSGGVYLINDSGYPIAVFSEVITLGDNNGLHVTLSANPPELAFWDGETKVAYVNSETLFIKSAEITDQFRIGKFVWKTQGINRISLVYAP